MRGSVGSNVNRRKLTAKYSKKTTSTPAKDIVVSTSNKSLTTSTVPTRGQQRATSQSIAKEQPVRKIVPASTSTASMGIVIPALNAEALVKEKKSGTPAVSKDLLEREISRDPETGRWDMNKDMQGWTIGQKFVQGLVSPYEQPVQLVKNIIDNVPAEQQMVKETGLDLLINPLIETVAGAKESGLTSKNFYWPDQLTGLDAAWAPEFLRTGGGSGSDLIGGLANNLGYLQDVITHEKTGEIIGTRYDESGERFMEQPAMYIGSAIGEVPLWFIGVGQAKAAVTISSKLAVTAVKMTAATGKLPGPATIKGIVQTERAANAVDKNLIKAKSTIDNNDTKINLKLPKNLDRAVNAALNVIKRDQDIPLKNKIDAAGVTKNTNEIQQRLLGKEITQMKRVIKSTPLSASEKQQLNTKIKSNHLKIKNLEKKWKVVDNSIKDNSGKLNIAKLRKEFKDFKRQNKSKDKNISRSSKAQYIEWIETKIQPEIHRKYKELPNQVDVIQTTKLAHLQSSIDSIKSSANKLVGSKNIDASFWEQAKIHQVGKQLGDKVTPKQRNKLIKLRNRKLDLELEMQRISTSDNWAPFGNTIRTLENIPGKTRSSWRNRWKTTALIGGDDGIFGKMSDGTIVKNEELPTGILENIDGKTPLPPGQRSYGEQSGRLWGMFDYHRDNISKLRNRQVTAIAKKLGDSFVDVGWIKKADFIAAKTKITKKVKPKIIKELDALREQRKVYESQKTDLENIINKKAILRDPEVGLGRTRPTYVKYSTKPPEARYVYESPMDSWLDDSLDQTGGAEYGDSSVNVPDGWAADVISDNVGYGEKHGVVKTDISVGKKYSTKRSNINESEDASIQTRIGDLDYLIGKQSEKISVQENLLSEAESYTLNLGGVVPGKGKSKGKYYFEPEFLKQYMGDEYQTLVPSEILYPKRPIIKATRFGNEIEVQLGSNFDSPTGMIEGTVSIKPPVIPKGRIKKTIKRFTPRPKILNRGMTLDNTEFIFTKQVDNPVATDAIRIPTNAPDDLKDFLTRGYYQKASKDKPSIKFLQGLTGGETSDLWIARPRPTNSKNPLNWDEKNINVGYTSSFASKDSQLDKANQMLRSWNEIEATRAVLTGDKNLVRDQRIDVLTKNTESHAKELTSLNAKVGIDDVIITTTERKRITFLKKQLDKDLPTLRKLQKAADSQSQDEFLLAQSGIGFGQRRGLVGRFDLKEGKNIKKINESPVIHNINTGKYYYVAEVNNQRKIYELDNPSVADKIRPAGSGLATKFPETAFGATEDGLVDMSTKFEIPGSPKAAITTPNEKDLMIRLRGPISGREATAEMTSKYIKENIIILGDKDNTAFSLKSKGIRELTTTEVSEFEKGAAFSNLVGEIRDNLRKTKTGPDKSGKSGEGVSTSIKKQMTDFIKINAKTKTLSAFEKGSVKIKGIKKAVVGDDEWVRMQTPLLRINDDMYESLSKGGPIQTGADDISDLSKALSAKTDPEYSINPLSGTVDDISETSWNPTNEITDTKVTGLDMYNVIDLGIIGGRERGNIKSSWVKDSVKRREYNTYLKAEGEKDAYEELLFAAKMNDSERVFRTNLVIAYERMQGKKYYDTPDDTVRTDAATKSTAEINKKIDEMVVYEDDPVTKLPVFKEKNPEYIKMVSDIKKNNLLREVTLKDRTKVIGRKRGGRLNPKTIEQRAGIISIKYNFGKLSENLPSHSLVGRITNRAVSKLQSTDNFFTGGLLTGFREKLNYKLNKKNLVETMDDPEDLEGFHQAIEFMRRNNNPVDRMYKAKYDTTKGRVDSRNTAIKQTDNENMNSYIEDKGGVSMWVEGDLTDAEKLRIKQIDKEMEGINSYLNNAKSKQTQWGTDNFEEVEKNRMHVKRYLSPPGTIGTEPHMKKNYKDMWAVIGKYKVPHSEKGQPVKYTSLKSPLLKESQRVSRLEQASIELALEKTRLEKKYIDSNEYSGYSVKIRELNAEKQRIWKERKTAYDDDEQPFDVSNLNIRPASQRFKTGFGTYARTSYITSQKAENAYMDSIDFNIRYLKDQQGKPLHTGAMGKNTLKPEQTDLFYNIKDSSNNIVATTGNLKGSNLTQSILKQLQRDGILDKHAPKDGKWDDTSRIKAWNKAIEPESTPNTDDFDEFFVPLTRNENARSILENNGFNVEDFNHSGSITRVMDGKNIKYHYALPNISGKSDESWYALSPDSKLDIYHKQGYDAERVIPAQEFSLNRQQLPDERGTLVQSQYHKETISDIEKWQKIDLADKKKTSPMTKKHIKWKLKEKEKLDKRVKPANINYGEKGKIDNITFDLMERKNVIAPGGEDINRQEFFMSDISNTAFKISSDIKIEKAKQVYLKEMGVDTKALMPMKDILKMMKTKKQSLKEIQGAENIQLNPKSTPTARKKAEQTIKNEGKTVTGIDNELKSLQSAYATQKPQTTISQTRKVTPTSDVRVKFFSFSQSDLTPDYRGQSKSKGISVPFSPAYAETPLGVNITPKPIVPQDNKQKNDGGLIKQAYASTSTDNITNLLPDISLGLPSLLSGMKINNKLQPAQTNRLDANLGWLSAQLSSQITKPLTSVETITVVDSAMKIGTALKTSTLLKLGRTYRIIPKEAPQLFKKYKSVEYQSITQKQKTQAILPVMLGPLPWEAAEERKRKRKKKPKRKSAKTWWQTPENWYESNYWGKSGEGSGYVTFKGSEPKRLKDRKNQFGF